jgi:sec-independent protein translocase protein TatA
MWTPGPLEIIIVLVIVLVIFGPKRLPDLGRSLGRGMREFKDSVTGKDKEHEEIESKTVGDDTPDSPATTASTTTREQTSAGTTAREQQS